MAAFYHSLHLYLLGSSTTDQRVSGESNPPSRCPSLEGLSNTHVGWRGRGQGGGGAREVPVRPSPIYASNLSSILSLGLCACMISAWCLGHRLPMGATEVTECGTLLGRLHEVGTSEKVFTVPIPPSPRPRSIRTEVPSDGPAFTLTSPAESNKQHHGARPLRLPSRARV